VGKVASEHRVYLKADVVICSVRQLHRARDLLLCLDCVMVGATNNERENQRDNKAKIPSTFLFLNREKKHAGESVSRHPSNSPNSASENNTKACAGNTLTNYDTRECSAEEPYMGIGARGARSRASPWSQTPSRRRWSPGEGTHARGAVRT